VSRLNIRITGVVQGVGYRYFVSRRATEYGLRGWVKNHADGSVQIDAIGAKGHLEDFLKYVRIGPPGSRVAGVTTQWHEDEPEYAGFDIRF
jgi:acylphosphatase